MRAIGVSDFLFVGRSLKPEREAAQEEIGFD